MGGAFGAGDYALASQPLVENGLHAVRYFVIDPRAGTVLSSGGSKVEALATARQLLRRHTRAANDEQWLQGELFPTAPAGESQRPVSRRRREVFERSGGRCCYCQADLDLRGTWHVEHQLPRALGGDDRPLNLMAACAACNLAKGPRTAIEFTIGSEP